MHPQCKALCSMGWWGRDKCFPCKRQVSYSGSKQTPEEAVMKEELRLPNSNSRLPGTPMSYGHLQNTGIFSCNWAALSLVGPHHGAKPQFLCMTPLILGFQLLLKLYLCQWPPDLSQHQPSAALRDSCMPSKSVPLGWLLHYQVGLPAWGTALATSGHSFYVNSEETLPRFTSVCWSLLPSPSSHFPRQDFFV